MTQIEYYREMNPYETNLFLINFYKRQYLKLQRIGISNETEFGVIVTEKLIKSTANRLDQLIKGKKTEKNMSDIEKGICKKCNLPKLYDSNRSYLGHITSKFHLMDLELIRQHIICNNIDYADGYLCDNPSYIDKITTAYNSETMRAVLSHNN